MSSLIASCSTASFTEIDRNYLTPFFTTQSGEEDENGKLAAINQILLLVELYNQLKFSHITELIIASVCFFFCHGSHCNLLFFINLCTNATCSVCAEHFSFFNSALLPCDNVSIFSVQSLF